MAHWAEVDTNNVVLRVIVGSNEEVDEGYSTIFNAFGGTWIKTSYNTYGGVHSSGEVPFRKNYAGKGMTYDPTRDAFIPIKPFPSWVLEEESCVWFPPVTYPGDGKFYDWNEETKTWDLWPNQPEPFPTRG